MLNFYRDIWFESGTKMGFILEMYYNMIMMYLIWIAALLGFFYLFYYSFNWTSKIVVGYYMEFIFFVLPILLLSLFLTYSMKALYMSEQFSNFHEYIIKITGYQWFWTIEYNIIGNYFKMNSVLFEDMEYNYNFRNVDTSNFILIPKKSYIMLLITSDDVIHSLGFPDVGLKVDAIPGRLNILELYMFPYTKYMNGFCTELCGPLHAFMPIQFHFFN